MKKRAILCTLLSGSLLLSGCSSILQRSYSSVTLHSAAPVVESDKLTIRVESYQDLVNALLYHITQGRETGTIRLYNYPYDVERDLEAACKEVIFEDPLGSYAVEHISYDITPIVSCYEATVHLTFRRTTDQIAKILSVTGTSSIRAKLQKALSAYQDNVVLRINYLDDEDSYLTQLLKEAYYASPQTALGFPEVEVHLYPESGPHRIAEFLFSYPSPVQELKQRSQLVTQKAEELLRSHPDISDDAGLLALCSDLRKDTAYLSTANETAYGALVEGTANSTGLALTVQLLCQKLEAPCRLVEGHLNGSSHTWVIMDTQDGPRHLDITQSLPLSFHSDSSMSKAGYHWDTTAYPTCGE